MVSALRLSDLARDIFLNVPLAKVVRHAERNNFAQRRKAAKTDKGKESGMVSLCVLATWREMYS